MNPDCYPRRILLCVAGLSPQIVTETLYALTVIGEPRFVPTEIHLLTTAEGAERARLTLLSEEPGWFHRLRRDYGLPEIRFTLDTLHLLRAADGRPLNDIREVADNEALADAITAKVRELTTDPDSAVHASIAGGRKTMGFYLGYALSLFGRPQDRLSHVLVSSPFENHPEFFYPPATPRRLATQGGQHIDTAEARVTLARIPVVRLRHGQPQALLGGHASYGDTVAAIQQSLAPPRLHIDLPARRVHCGTTPVNLPPAHLAWLAWWAQQALQQHGPQNWRSADAPAFLSLYRRVVGVDAVAYENAQKRLHGGMEKEFFEQNNAKLERAIKAQLGLAAAPYLLTTSGKRPHTARSLGLDAQAITLRL